MGHTPGSEGGNGIRRLLPPNPVAVGVGNSREIPPSTHITSLMKFNKAADLAQPIEIEYSLMNRNLTLNAHCLDVEVLRCGEQLSVVRINFFQAMLSGGYDVERIGGTKKRRLG